VRFLTLAEALVIAEAVTGISARTLQSAALIEAHSAKRDS
jgi:hypothetical protein